MSPAGVLLCVGLLALSTQPLAAFDRSPHPAPRPHAQADVARSTEQALRSAPVPRPRQAMSQPRRSGILLQSERPAPRGTVPQRKARVTITRPSGAPTKVGRICGNRKIKGRPVPDVPGSLPGCGVRDPVQVVEVEGVRLSTASTMTCETATALAQWVKSGAKTAVGRTGGGLAELRVAAHYSCRTRNNQPGAKLSEHGRGKAIDISGVTLKDGTVITLLQGWNHKRYGKILRAMHKTACGPFGTVLGPESDRFHKDHFHFDVARYRSGPYCR